MSEARKTTRTMEAWISLGHLDPVTHKLVEAFPNVRRRVGLTTGRDKRNSHALGVYFWVLPAHLRNGFEFAK